jgi:hypothetical protein
MEAHPRRSQPVMGCRLETSVGSSLLGWISRYERQQRLVCHKKILNPAENGSSNKVDKLHRLRK